jgi:hypothetical protein
MKRSSDLGWRSLWLGARWPARLLFVGLVALFVTRSIVSLKVGVPDRQGFLRMGAAALDGDFSRELTLNTYPPAFPVVMAPLEALRRLTGDAINRHLWGAGQLIALGFATLELGRALELDLTLGAVNLAWLSVWRPIVADLNNQNVSLFLLAMVAAALRLLRRERPAAAGMVLGAGMSLKLWPGLALLGYARRPRVFWPLCGGVLVALGLASLAVVMVLGPSHAGAALHYWLTEVAPQAGGPELANQSWRAEVLRLTGELGPDAVTGSYVWRKSVVGSLGLAVGAALWMAFAFFTLLRPGRSARVACLDSLLSLILGTAALPVAWPHSYVVLLPLALALAGSIPTLRCSGRALLWLFAAGAVLTSFLDYDLIGRPFAARLAFYGPGLLGALCMCAAGLGLRRSWQASDAPEPPAGVGIRSPEVEAVS